MIVYVALLDEGTEVWRPVEAGYLGEDRHRLLGEVPEGEAWEFKPGDTVRCTERKLSEGMVLVASEKIGC